MPGILTVLGRLYDRHPMPRGAGTGCDVYGIFARMLNGDHMTMISLFARTSIVTVMTSRSNLVFCHSQQSGRGE